MWLERFSGHSGPDNNDGSPIRGPPALLTRKSTHVGPNSTARRPEVLDRSSSLSILSLGNSTDSLPSAARIATKSHLRHETRYPFLADAGESADTADSLEALDSILGTVSINAASPGVNLISHNRSNAASLQAIAEASIDEDPEETTAVTALWKDFQTEQTKFDELHRSIQACDEVLRAAELYLNSFRSELAAVSSEIEHLQSRSETMNNELEKRRIVGAMLSPEVNKLVIPPSAVQRIVGATVDFNWVKALNDLEHRALAIENKVKQSQDGETLKSVNQLINSLSDKAVERIRDHIVSQIRALRSPNIDAQIIQQANILRCKDAFAFLSRRSSQLASDISQAYTNTMAWYYSSHFARYKLALEKLRIYQFDQPDALTSESNAKRAVKAPASQDLFSLGRRAEILRSVVGHALPSFAAIEDKGIHFIETAFQAFNLALVDNASAEYSFLCNFFTKRPFAATNRQFTAVFGSTFELGYSLTKQLIDATFDAVGVLLCIRLTQQLAFELQRRKVPTVESYINGTNMLLWPRFQVIIDAHCGSIRKATASLTGKPAGSALSLTASASNTQTVAPHTVTQKFANLTQSVLAVSEEAGDDEPISASIGRLRVEYEAFLLKLSKSIAEPRRRDRFLFNNYSLICTIVADSSGKLAEDIKAHFAALRDSVSQDD